MKLNIQATITVSGGALGTVFMGGRFNQSTVGTSPLVLDSIEGKVTGYSEANLLPTVIQWQTI